MAVNTTNAASVNLYILTFNCGRALIDVNAFASQLFDGLEPPMLQPPDLLVLSLQELAPISHAFIGGSFLVPYFQRFHDAVQSAAAIRNLGMTAIMVFARNPSAIQDIESAGVGVGMAEMGNKGAIGVRFTYGHGSESTELTFVAAHLAAMEEEVLRRNQDWKNIVRGLVFSSSTKAPANTASSAENRPLLSISPQDASIYKSTSHLFIAGDLNYRTSSMSPSPSDHIETFPQPHQDASSPKHISSLFERDQLNKERAAGRTLHGLTEWPVRFPPTYKYDSKEPFLTPDEQLSKWHWAKHRWPSWCDRILYLEIPPWMDSHNNDFKLVAKRYTALPLQPTTDHRAVTINFRVSLIPIPKPGEEEETVSRDPRVHPPFDIDINWKSRRDRARTLELVVGFAAYFATTREGNIIVAATFVGIVGGFYVIKALLME
ncbi:Inositol polyphosphate 5-phosphatase OCRL-1 [Hyphodiscus hymeniophilus]|uniref:Inositol polyphosphate 5-phosphatase OCRL-1 n=1 Tax=Hyphodiscus hymeniophilus TaxID=353542 RepID=A0A9P6VLZ9_9HELO|nr:Inositol polyphosphate 5-phosphatase OCRL-1 [Hyphodiscus hymeniophilus]